MTSRPAPKPAPLTPVQTVDRMTQIAIRLEEVLTAETEVLKNREPGKVVDFHEEKTRLTNEFALHVNAIKKTPQLIDRAPAERVASLKQAMGTLHARSDQSGQLLIAAKSVSDGILKTVADVAARKRAPQTGYGRSGAMTQTTNRGTPLSLDAQI